MCIFAASTFHRNNMGLLLLSGSSVLKPSLVFIFYDYPMTREVREIERNLNRFRRQYPGYDYHFQSRQETDCRDTLRYIADTQIFASRCLPLANEETPAIVAEQNCEKANMETFRRFMNRLVEVNSERYRQLGLTANIPINEAVETLHWQSENPIDFSEAKLIFLSDTERKIKAAHEITLRLEPIGEYGYGVQGEWIPVLDIDGERHEVEATKSRHYQLMFFYLLLHPNKVIEYSDFTRGVLSEQIQSEVSRIMQLLYRDLTCDNKGIQESNFKSLWKYFVNASKNKLIGNVRDTPMRGEDPLAVVPYSWIKNETPVRGRSALWIFSPPDNVTIDTESFRQAMNWNW